MIMSTDYGARKHGLASLRFTLVLALHLILVLLWVGNGRKQIDQGAEQRHFILTWVPAQKSQKPQPPAPSRAPQASPRALPARVPNAMRVVPTIDAKTVPIPAETPQPIVTAPGAPDAVDVNQIMDTAKRQAGLIDRDLRGGKPAPLAPDPELPIVRFRSALESAYIDRSRTMVMDVQTQPDGVVVYRFRRGGKVWCRQSGDGGPSMIEHSDAAKLAGAGSGGGGSKAGTVACPSGESGWSRL